MKKKVCKIILTVYSVMTVVSCNMWVCHAATDVEKETENAVSRADELLSQNIFGEIFGAFIKGVEESVGSFMKVFASMLFLTFMLGIMRMMSAKNTAVYAGEICLCGFSFSVISHIISTVGALLEGIESFMLSLLPVMTTLYTASSAPTSAAVNYSSSLIVLNVCSTVFPEFIVPGIKCIVFLAVISFVSRSFDFSGIIRFLKNTVGWFFGLLMCIMSAVIAFQNVISVSKDGILGRTVRFAASRFIPVMGNTVSESARTVSESLKLVRSVSGIAGIFALIGLIASPIAALLVCRFFINLCGACARLFSCAKASAFFGELSGVVNLMLGVVTGVSLLLIMILGMFAKMGVIV